MTGSNTTRTEPIYGITLIITTTATKKTFRGEENVRQASGVVFSFGGTIVKHRLSFQNVYNSAVVKQV